MIFLPAIIHFCEHHLVADDPWQYRDLTIDQLVDLFYKSEDKRTIIHEMNYRLTRTNLSEEDREILIKTLFGIIDNE